MRRSWISHGALNQSRSGVTASVTSSNRKPHSPSVSWIFSTGFAPRLLPPISNALKTSDASGSRHSRNSAGLNIRRTTMFDGIDSGCVRVRSGCRWGFSPTSIKFLQIHSLVQRRDFLLIAVEHRRRHARLEQPTADAPLARLGPARMVDLRIDVGVEAVFVRRRDVPRRRRLTLAEADLDDR